MAAAMLVWYSGRLKSAVQNTYQQAHIPHIWLPIAIDSVPTSEQRQAFQQFVEQQMALGHGVAVHCSTGRHRTGTMLAAYLIQTGQTYEQAMAILLVANPEIELPIPQAKFLQMLGQAEAV
jgi:protein-tyrosine phosphatase